jgi:putative FmdB family regulatory protein
MPIYGYICEKCSHGFQTLVMSSDDIPACPSCGSAKLEQQLSLIAVPAKSQASDMPMCNGAGGCGMACPGMCD